MPRFGGVVLADHPHHVAQRGHDRGVVFVEKRDYEYYLANLPTFKQALAAACMGSAC